MDILESFIEKGCYFVLETDNGKYLSLYPIERSGADNLRPPGIKADKEELDTKCIFLMELIDENTIALKSLQNNNYFCR